MFETIGLWIFFGCVIVGAIRLMNGIKKAAQSETAKDAAKMGFWWWLNS